MKQFAPNINRQGTPNINLLLPAITRSIRSEMQRLAPQEEEPELPSQSLALQLGALGEDPSDEKGTLRKMASSMSPLLAYTGYATGNHPLAWLGMLGGML